MNTNKKTKQSGFTLIELMIVVGIIGVLSAIAIPAYKSYLLKTEANTAVSVPRTLLTNIDLFIQEKGKFPNSTEAADLEEIGANTDMSAMGTISITPTSTGAKTGKVLFTVGENASLVGKKVEYTRTVNGWKCIHDTGETLKGCTSGTIS